MSSTGPQLLLVDDDPSAIRVMSRMLAAYPNQRFATNGADALRLAREAPPDLILLDADMPGMSGFDVCDALKADPQLARVPVIVATSHDTPDIEAAALHQGAADFVKKPLVAIQLTARVRAQLRAHPPGAQPQTQPLPQAQPLPVPRILIVDDDVIAINVLRKVLAPAGDFYFARSGQAAIEMAERLLPDLILLDAHMPEVDGFEVCRQLKARRRLRHVPIVFVTRYGDPRNEMRALDLGASDFIAKPYTPAVLKARVRNLLDLKLRTDREMQSIREHWRQLSDERVAEIVSTATDGIVSCDASGCVVLINTAACLLFGVVQSAVIGQPLAALLGTDFELAVSAQNESRRLMLLRADGSAFTAEVSVSAVGMGADRLSSVMLRDVGQRERLEAELRARAQAEAASRAKTQLLSYFAHEIGNPLNAVMGFAQLMKADHVHVLPAEQALRLDRILQSAAHLRGLMRDVLDLGAQEAGKLQLELAAVDAVACVQDAAGTLAAQAAHAGVSIELPAVELPVAVLADARRLAQCVVNLLGNAIKYNRRGGCATVSIGREPQRVVIAVRDDGLGLNAAQRSQLFEPFNRLGRQGSAAPGTGLGLVITRQLVQAMGGELRVDSVAGQGSCFAIVLPAAAEADDHDH